MATIQPLYGHDTTTLWPRYGHYDMATTLTYSHDTASAVPDWLLIDTNQHDMATKPPLHRTRPRYDFCSFQLATNGLLMAVY